MVVTKENLSDLKERYEEAQKLFDEESKLDPITNPYRSAYAAREILNEIQHNLKNILDDLLDENDETASLQEDIFVYKCVLAIVLKDLGRNFITTEEISEGDKHLTKAIEVLEELQVKPETVITYVECFNEKGLLATSNDVGGAKEYFDKAEDIYINFKNSTQQPLTIYDIFGTKDEIEAGKGMLSLEKNYTLTLYYKAQVYTKLEDLHNSAWCCHKTLKRQLEFKDFDPLDWGLNAAVLSQYFFSHHKFTESRHHLSAANLMFDNYREKMITDEMTEDQKVAALEKYNHNNADLMRCWGKYGLYILLSSKERLMVDDETANNIQDLSKLKIYSEDLKFDSLDLQSYESQITDKYCLTFDDAKKVFLNVQDWFNKAKEYYTSDGEATEHAKIIQDLSSSFSLLAFYEEDSANQCKLHKRRADLLEDIVKVYNPNYYINICREIWYELSLLYSNMLDIKLDILNDQSIAERPTPHALNKINQLCDKSIKNFNEFLDSYRNKQTGEIAMNILSFEDRQSILVAYFHIGRLYYKKITPDKLLHAKNINDSLTYYNLFVKTCSDTKDSENYFKAEIGVCREMVELLPRKLAMLMEEIRQQSNSMSCIN